jgi:hypothetical protein
LSINEIMTELPRDLHGRGVRGAIVDVLRRRFKGVNIKSAIRPNGRSSIWLRVWAIGPGVVATLRGDLVAIWNVERSRRTAEADNAAEDDFGEPWD